jgi:hypothetical protein
MYLGQRKVTENERDPTLQPPRETIHVPMCRGAERALIVAVLYQVNGCIRRSENVIVRSNVDFKLAHHVESGDFKFALQRSASSSTVLGFYAGKRLSIVGTLLEIRLQRANRQLSP